MRNINKSTNHSIFIMDGVIHNSAGYFTCVFLIH